MRAHAKALTISHAGGCDRPSSGAPLASEKSRALHRHSPALTRTSLAVDGRRSQRVVQKDMVGRDAFHLPQSRSCRLTRHEGVRQGLTEFWN